MSRIKNLQTDSENVINMVEVLQLFIPEGKSKYVETLLRIMKKTKNLNVYTQEMRESWSREFGIKPESLNSFNDVQLLFMYRFIDGMFNYSDLKSFIKFCEYNERGLIENNDLSRYSNFDEIMVSTGLAEIKVIEKDLEKQIINLHSDDEWVVIKPLTYIASRKYGSSTKWCTTQETNPEYFLRYAGKGILIYTMNKKTGLKVAAYKSLIKDDPELSFWNQIDNRIDSMESALPTFILEIIRNEFQNCYTPNLDLLSYQDKKAQQQLLETMQKKSMSIAISEMDMREEPLPMIEDGPMEERAYSEPDMEVSEAPREILNERYVNEDIGEMAMQATPRNVLGR
jgi:hypothetical protein